ncbi:hypothetical protein ANCCAN_28986, partial [Ancylostoma caninum]
LFQVKFPQEEDLSGAATAILRLQDVYKLDSTDLSNGIILGEKVSHKLTAHDAFEVGRAAYNEKDYYHTLTWMQTALNRIFFGNRQKSTKAPPKSCGIS